MNVVELILNILVSTGAAAAVAGGIVWLAKEFLSSRIKESIKSEYDHRLETHKAQIKAEYDFKIESHKNQLKSESDVAVEKLRSQLSIAASQRQTRFSNLHVKRAETITEIYAALRDAVACVSDYTKVFEPVGGASREERRTKAVEAANAFAKLYSEKQIFLPEAAAKKLDAINNELKGAFILFVYGVDMAGGMSKNSTQAWVEVDSKVRRLSDIALRELEKDFRHLLGDEESDISTPPKSG